MNIGSSSAARNRISGTRTTHMAIRGRFESAPPAGKDPFFPNSSRGPKISKAEPVVVRIPEIGLKGITGTVTKRLCILNNRTFEVGEIAEMKVSGQTVIVKCLEIKNNSAIVTINGLEKELNLVPR